MPYKDPEAQRRYFRERGQRYYQENKVAINAKNKAYHEAHLDEAKVYGRAYRFRVKYDITPAEFDALFAAQGEKCAICLSPEPTNKGWHLDHDHATGQARGVLCHPCNVALGFMQDDASRLRSAAAYLERPPPELGRTTPLPSPKRAGPGRPSTRPGYWCRKRKYPDELSASKGNILRGTVKERQAAPRTYLCLDCKSWHLTTSLEHLSNKPPW